jgi:hypothetical protein
VLADDLVGAVAVDALGAGVPGGDVALRIEHEDRVVEDAVDELAVALLALAQAILGAAPLAEIAGDLAVADQAAALVADGADGDAGPQARAVLAEAPAFFLVAAGGLGELELLLALARLDVVLAVEDREVLAQDLALAVQVDALGAGVPRGDLAAGIEGEHRIVADAVEEQAQPLLALA